MEPCPLHEIHIKQLSFQYKLVCERAARQKANSHKKLQAGDVLETLRCDRPFQAHFLASRHLHKWACAPRKPSLRFDCKAELVSYKATRMSTCNSPTTSMQKTTMLKPLSLLRFGQQIVVRHNSANVCTHASKLRPPNLQSSTLALTQDAKLSMIWTAALQLPHLTFENVI